MKKGLCITLAIAMLMISLVACGKKDDEYANITTQTNANSEAYVNVTDKDGNDVTNENGEKETSVLSDEEKSKVEAAQKNTTTTTTSANLLSDLTGIDQEFNPNASKDDLLEKGTSAAKTTLRDDVIGAALKNKKFTIATKIVSEGGEMPATISMNGDEIATKVSISGIDARMIMKDNKTYLAFDATKIYMEMEGGEFDMSDLAPSVAEKDTYVGTTTVNKDGKTYICEEYKTDSGAVTKYYFLDNKWVRYEHVEGDTVSILDVTDFKGSADANLFSLDKYTKIDMDSINSLV